MWESLSTQALTYKEDLPMVGIIGAGPDFARFDIEHNTLNFFEFISSFSLSEFTCGSIHKV